MEQIGNYKITKKIADGGMAVVYQGVQESLKRPVAIKLLKQQFSQDSRIIDYFNRESLIIARLIHPNIIHVIDRGLTKTGMPYFVMNFIKGTETTKLISNKELKFNRKLDIIIQTCKALAYAHKNGVIHRDIKPANILIDTEGNAIVTDFGIAQFYQQGKNSQQNKTKELLGTPTYMSPEQKQNSSSVTFASDIYSLGVVMYELFTSTRFSNKLQKPSTLSPEIPEPLERIILQCFNPNPDKRPASVEAIKNQLFLMFKGAHLKKAQRKKALSGAPKMNDIFSILDVIKETKSGSTYLLRHTDSEQLMVAKTLNTLNTGVKTAKVLLSMKHDNIVDIQGVSGSDNNYIIVMEYLSGGSLADRMVMLHTWQEALRVIQEICHGLLFAHNNRIIHGNLRPSNILLTKSEKVKISDFGLGAGSSGIKNNSKQNLIELIQNDILATGAVLYKMILGFGPVLKGDSFAPHKQFKILPNDIKRLIYRFLSQKPSIRFQSIKQVIDEINKINEVEFAIEETSIVLDEDLSDSPQKTIVEEVEKYCSPESIESIKQRRRPGSFLLIIFLITLFAASISFIYFNAPDKFLKIIQEFLARINFSDFI